MTPDEVEIVLVAGGAATSVGVLGLGAARLLRRWSVRWQLVLVAVVSVVAVLVGVLAVAQRMFLSAHDLGVVTLVTATASTVAVAVSLVLAAAVVRWSQDLRAEVSRVGTAAPSPGGVRSSGPAEFQQVADELAVARVRLEEAAQHAAALEEARRQLVAWVSHDLRTPLAGMRAMLEALEDGLAVDPARYRHQIGVEIDRMVRMVDDLFELSRIHAGSWVLRPEPVDLRDLVSDAVAAAEPVATARGVELVGAVDDGLQLVADPGGLSRVVANLVTNAIRHTPGSGRVEVLARARGSRVELAVSDGCGGIEVADLERVFDVAWQASPARTPDGADADRSGRGAGLGLAIVKGIVEAHRGEVRVENRSGGCRFLVDLPGDATPACP